MSEARVCLRCAKKLSSLNKDVCCYHCQEQARRERLGPLKRPYVRKGPYVPVGTVAGPVKRSPEPRPTPPPAPLRRSQEVPSETRAMPAVAVEVVPMPPAPEPQPATAPERKERMDKLVYEEIELEEIPRDAVEMRKPIGRIGEMWLRLEELSRRGKAMRVPCRDKEHAGYTARQIRHHAKRHKRELEDVVRKDAVLYLSLKSLDASARVAEGRSEDE